MLVPHVAVSLGDRDLQHRVLRPAIVVHAGDGSADRLFPRRVVGSVAGLSDLAARWAASLFGQLGGISAAITALATASVFASPASFHVIAFCSHLLTIPTIRTR